jgi:predicted CXXCH cytochrome family protein
MSTAHRLAIVASIVAIGACTNEKIVYQTREPFNPPADTVHGFLGYYTVATKQTTCGNCHEGFQATWKQTKHASAWSDLIGAMANPPQACKNCHSVTQLGNAVPDTTPAGYAAVPDTTYHDVQCESCHGPGYTHAQAPSLSNIPLARIAISPDTTISVTSATCAACHNDTHHPFVEEWSQSGHAQIVTDAATNASCQSCHEARGVLKAWGVNTNYIEKNVTVTLATALPTVCSVCHDPHANNNQGQLRWPIDNPDPTQNLCMKCHNRRSDPVANSPRGPHAPQGAVVLGYAGYWGANYRDTVEATHGNVNVNPRLCAGCHVNAVTVTDTAGNFQFQSVGHLFIPDPCLVNGQPTAGDCARPGDGGYVSGSRAFTGCAKGGCHNSATQAENAMQSQRSVIAALADALWKDNDGDQSMYDTLPGGKFANFDAGDTGLLTQLSAQQADTAYNYKDNVVSVAEGVLFNVRLLGENRYANGDRSLGVHNPLLYQLLLSNSIDQLKTRYGLPVPPAVQQLVDQTRLHVRLARSKASQISSR